MAVQERIVIDASAMGSINYDTYFSTYFQDLGTGTRNWYGGEYTPAVFSYVSGTQAGFNYGGNTAEGAKYVLLEGVDMGYNGRFAGDTTHSYSGNVNSLTFGTIGAGAVFPAAVPGGTRAEASGILSQLSISNLEAFRSVFSVPVGEGVSSITDVNADDFNPVYAFATWLKDAGGANHDDYVARLYQLLAKVGQEFIGTTGADTYTGTAFDDIIKGNGGNDVIDGGSGENDQFVVNGNIADFEVVANVTSAGTTFSVKGGTWTATLKNVEFVVFNDGKLNIASTPGNLALSGSSVKENAAAGTVVGVLSAVDPDGSASALKYTVKNSDFFTTSGNKLVVKKGADYETAKSHTIEVEVRDADGNTAVKTFTINVTDVNEKPFDLKISKSKVKENVKVGTVVGTISASDVDAGDKVSYSLAAGSSKSFKIVGDKLVVAKALDYETLKSHSVTLVATDKGGLSVTRTINIGVTDVVDVVVGTKGNNTLRGGNGVDKISGGAGNDKISGLGGNDTLHGNSGHDKLYGGSGADKLYGDSGNDSLYGESGNDTLRGGTGNDKLYGGTGADKLYGGSGVDKLYGGSGNDKLYGDSGNDKLYGDSGNDTLYGGSGNDKLFGDRGADKLYGGTGNDKLYGGSGNDTLDGGTGDDVLYGESGSDTLTGGFGNDKLYGGAGNDLLKGGAGNDILKGESGNDRLYGGNGADKLYGGSGADTFIFLAVRESTVKASGRDTIYDFNGKGGDRIDLSGLDANSTKSGMQKFSFIGDANFSGKAGELAYRIEGGKTVVEADLNGDGKADFAVNLYGHHTLLQSDFLL